MRKKQPKRIQRSAAALISAAAILAGGAAVSADDDIMFDPEASSYDDGGGSGGSIGSIDASDSGFLIEDTGDDVQYNAGVPMDTLQDAMEAGDQKLLDKIASLGALTGSTTSSGSGIGGGGAYRGMDDEDEDDESYYDLHLDEGDADEVQSEALNESPGPLIAASRDRIQEYLDAMTEVESPTGSDGELTVASYIETKMGELGYTVQEQAFHEGVLNEDGIDAPGVNILAERGANSQTNRKKDIFLVVTHYDSKRSPDEDDPFANDKSGAAALIETARILAEVVTDTDVCFLFLSGQEDGGYGAQNFFAALSEENLARISGVLSVERVGYDSDTPYVLKTLTGESNSLGDIVQQLGLTNDAQIAQREAEASSEEELTWVPVGQSSDGYIDEKTAAQIAAAQGDASYGEENAISIDTNEYLEEGAGTTSAGEETLPGGGTAGDGMPADGSVAGDGMPMDGSGEDFMLLDETEAEPVPMPSPWSYLKDSPPTLESLTEASFPSVTVSQYMPELDAASYEETKALGLADTTLEAAQQAAAEAAGAYSEDNAIGAEAAGTDGTDAGSASTDGVPEDAIQIQDSNMTGSADETLLMEDGTYMEMPEGDASLEVSEGDTNLEMPEGSAGLENPSPDAIPMDAIPSELDEFIDIPVVNATLVADTTNVIAAALAQIMDPAT